MHRVRENLKKEGMVQLAHFFSLLSSRFPNISNSFWSVNPRLEKKYKFNHYCMNDVAQGHWYILFKHI